MTVEPAEPRGDDAGCVFCRIVARQEAASVVLEDDAVLAIMDVRPVTTGHVLVMPKVHAPGLESLDPVAGARVWRAAHRIALGLRRSGLRCEGVNLFLADGEAAFQEVWHVHLHVVPRFRGDGFRLEADWRVRPRDELDAAAAAVRRGLAAPR